MKIWADACVTPELAFVANKRGYEGTSNRQRALLTSLDPVFYPTVVGEDWVFVTNNESDFRDLASAEDFHPGLIVVPQALRELHKQRFDLVLAHIEKQAALEGEEPAIWMMNRVVEYEESTGQIHHDWLPQP